MCVYIYALSVYMYTMYVWIEESTHVSLHSSKTAYQSLSPRPRAPSPFNLPLCPFFFLLLQLVYIYKTTRNQLKINKVH